MILSKFHLLHLHLRFIFKCVFKEVVDKKAVCVAPTLHAGQKQTNWLGYSGSLKIIGVRMWNLSGVQPKRQGDKVGFLPKHSENKTEVFLFIIENYFVTLFMWSIANYFTPGRQYLMRVYRASHRKVECNTVQYINCNSICPRLVLPFLVFG